MRFFDVKLLFAMALFVVTMDNVLARRHGRSGGDRNWCENKGEFNSCKKDCYSDRDCNDEANLNCSVKCKQACLRLEKVGRCRGALLSVIMRNRGRLGGSRGGRSRDDFDGPRTIGNGSGGKKNNPTTNNNRNGGGNNGGNNGGAKNAPLISL